MAINPPLPKVTRVLIVEDEPAQMQAIRNSLESHGTFHLTFAQNGQEAFQRLREEIPDLILMDLDLPDCNGLDLICRLRQEDQTRWVPVIILTERCTVKDIILGLEIGADDYLTKLVDPGELVARVRAVLRSKQSPAPMTDFENNGFKISANHRQVWLNENAVAMTRKEFDLLLMIVSKRGA